MSRGSAAVPGSRLIMLRLPRITVVVGLQVVFVIAVLSAGIVLFGASSAAASTYELTVVSNPDVPTDITVTPSDLNSDGDGQTGFTRTYSHGTQVHLTAPASITDGGNQRSFLRWVINDRAQPGYVRTVTFGMVVAIRAEAVYETATWEMFIRTTPFDSVTITGAPSGVTDYQPVVEDGTAITLTAPKYITRNGRKWVFYHWERNTYNLKDGLRTIRFAIKTRIRMVARYRYVKWLTINGPSSIPERSSRQFTCRATFNMGPAWVTTKSATWSETASCLSFRAPGLLHAGSVSQETSRLIRVTYGGVSKVKRIKITNQ